MKFKYLLLLLIFCKTTSIVAQVDLDAGLTAYYSFTGNTNDVTIYDNHAISSNPPILSLDCEGNNNNAYYFDGIDDYLEIASTAQNNFGNITDFAISLWIKPEILQTDTGGAVNDILSKWSGLTSDGYPYALRLYNQTNPIPGILWAARYESANYGCSEFPSVTSSTVVMDGNWHHVVFQKTGNLLQLYVDTNLEATTMDNTVCNVQNNSSIVLCNRTLNPGIDTRFYQGGIDELRMYNRSLNQAEIDSLNNKTAVCFEIINYTVLAGNCDLTGTEIQLTDGVGTVLDSQTIPADGGNGTFGAYYCGVYYMQLLNEPPCFTEIGGTIGQVLINLDGEGITNITFSPHAMVPTLSQWGLIIFALLIMVVASVKIFESTQNINRQKNSKLPIDNFE